MFRSGCGFVLTKCDPVKSHDVSWVHIRDRCCTLPKRINVCVILQKRTFVVPPQSGVKTHFERYACPMSNFSRCTKSILTYIFHVGLLHRISYNTTPSSAIVVRPEVRARAWVRVPQWARVPGSGSPVPGPRAWVPGSPGPGPARPSGSSGPFIRPTWAIPTNMEPHGHYKSIYIQHN